MNIIPSTCSICVLSLQISYQGYDRPVQSEGFIDKNIHKYKIWIPNGKHQRFNIKYVIRQFSGKNLINQYIYDNSKPRGFLVSCTTIVHLFLSSASLWYRLIVRRACPLGPSNGGLPRDLLPMMCCSRLWRWGWYFLGVLFYFLT